MRMNMLTTSPANALKLFKYERLQMTLRAFNNDKKLKAGLLKEVHKHYEQDQIVAGTYGEGTGNAWRGCAVGCSIRSYNLLTGSKISTSNHAAYEKFGFPEWLARLEDTI